MCGASGTSIDTNRSAASRVAGPVAPESSARWSPLVSVISFEMATLNPMRSRSAVTYFTVRWVSLRSSSPAVLSTSPPGNSAARCTTRHTLPSHLCTPDTDTAAQSMSSSGGLANIIASRTVSAPHRSINGRGSTTFPRLFEKAPPRK